MTRYAGYAGCARYVRYAACVTAAVGALVVVRAQAVKSDHFDAPQLLADLRALSADDMQGRRAGTPGGIKARAYVVERFKASGLAPVGSSFEHSFALRARNGEAARTGANVIGRVDGTAKSGRFTVVTAHYDHLGVAASGEVYNGADDNASGTAALFALAAHFRRTPPRHSILFVALDAEESGLEGARAFLQTPPVDVSALALNVNLDMIGRDPDNTLYVAGTRQQPFLKPFIEKAAARASVKLVMGHDDPNAKGVEDWTRDSDHYAFCQAKIPCLYLGVEDFANHHKTTDDYETMTHAFYVRAVEAAAHTIRELDAGLDAIVARAPSTAETPVEIPVPGGKVAGTLLMPVPANGQIPVAIIVAGSGPTDRDGNSPLLGGKNNSLKLLAEALAAGGIASVRYDKRGLLASAVKDLKETDLRFEDFVNDAAAWVTLLRNDARFASVTVIGHSEGSLIGMLAARAARADAFVSIAGVARRPSDVLRDQLRPQLAAAPALAEASERILKALEAGQTSQPVPSALVSLYRLSVQPYLISWFRYTPSVEFARVRAPALVLQGTTDLQVAVSEAELLKAAKPDATLRVVEGMNHVLKAAPVERAANIAAYSNSDLPLVGDVPAAIQAFVRGLRLPRHPTMARMSPRTTTAGIVEGARIAIEYGQLATRGREIWGALVPWNRVWMPGADETTTMTTSAPITFGSLVVPAGDHTIYTLPAESGFTLILSTQIFQFHTEYRPERDLGRVPMTLTRLDTPAERFAFEIRGRDGAGVLALRWADREYTAPFTVVPAGR